MTSMYDEYQKTIDLDGIPLKTFKVTKVGLNFVFKFGKHAGKTLAEVILLDRKYVKGLLDSGSFEINKRDASTVEALLYAKSKNDTRVF